MAKLSNKSRHPEAPAVEPGARLASVGPRAGGSVVASHSLFFLLPTQSKALDQFLAKTPKRRRPEMAPHPLEKIESAPGNGMVSEASKPQDLVHGRHG